MIDQRHGWNVSFKPVILGFVFSVILTLAAYRIVTHYHLTNSVLFICIIGLAIVQAMVQLIFYLQLCLEEKPRWNFLMFLLMVFVIVVLVVGTIWIMKNLGYNLLLDR